MKIYWSISKTSLLSFSFFFYVYHLCLQVNQWNCNQINATVVFISLYIAAKKIVLQYDFSVLVYFQAVCLQIIRSDP